MNLEIRQRDTLPNRMRSLASTAVVRLMIFQTKISILHLTVCNPCFSSLSGMTTPNVCILRAPGTNCDVETAHAFEKCGAAAQRVHLFRLLENPGLLSAFQILCIPGGFSYGDDIGAGVILSRQLRGRLGEAIGEFLHSDKLVLGICNGFQALLKSGILPGGADGWPSQNGQRPPATLTWNNNGKYTALWVRLGIVAKGNVFLKGLEQIDLPIAHAEGKLILRDGSAQKEWRQNGQIVLCYRRISNTENSEGNRDSESTLPYPDNPNGSVGNIAGLGDPSGRVLGLMPHPERFIHSTQHPHWTRDRLQGEGAGLKLFRNAVEYFA
jgi:phosphoribosylformylglycinamidine synthase I